MPRPCAFCLQLLLISSLAGCTAVSALQVGVIVLSLPYPAITDKVRLKGYTLGPVSSPDLPELVENSVPANEGGVLLAGHASWSGLSMVGQPGYRTQQTVAAMTETKFLFLWWNEEEESYEILMRLPYEDIRWIALFKPESGKTIKLCLEIEELAVGEETIAVDDLTQLSFMNSYVSRDQEMTRQAYVLLEERISHEEDLDTSSMPCGISYEPDSEHVGFGQEDPQNLD